MSDLTDLDIQKEALSGTVAQFATVGFGFVGTVAFARVLGPTDFGGVVLFLAIVGILGNPMDGFAVAVHKEVSGSTSVLDEALGSQLLFNLAWILVLTVPLAVFGGLFAAETGLQRASLLAVCYLATNSMLETLYSPLQGLGRIGLSYWLDTAKRIFGVTFRIVGVLAVGAVGMIYGSIAVAVLFLPFLFWVLGKRPTIPSASVFMDHARYAKFSMPSRLLSSLAKRFDVFLLGALATTATVSWYEVAWQLAIPGFYLVQSLGSSLMTKVSAMGRTADGVDAQINGVLTYASILAVPLFFGSTALGREVLTLLFGGKYGAATPFLIGLTAYQVVRSQSEPLELAAKGLNYPDAVLSVRVATAATNVVFGVWLLLTVGPIGVIYATILSGLVRFGLLLHLFRRRLGYEVGVQRQFGEQLAAGVVMFLIVSGADRLFTVDSSLATTLLLALGASTYFGTLALVGRSHRTLLLQLYERFVPS